MAEVTTTEIDMLSLVLEEEEEYHDPEPGYRFSNGRIFENPEDPYS